MCSMSVALILSSLLILRVRPPSDESNAKILFVYYKVANIPFAMDAPPFKNIYSVTTESADEKQLTRDGHSFNPVLSPDGTRIAYLHVTEDTCENCLVAPKYEINVMNADGTQPRTLVSIERPAQLSWSPDGRILVYGGVLPVVRQTGLGLPDLDNPNEMAALYSSAYPLYEIEPDREAPARLLAENAMMGLFNELEWSPDGKWLAYSCGSPQDRGRLSFHLCLLEPGELAEPKSLANGPLRYFWSPNGKEIVYSAFDPGANKPDKDAYGLFVVRTDGSAPRLLTTSNDGHTPQWSRDGTKIVFCEREKNKSLIDTINADGTGKVRLTTPKLDASHPVWSPDGKEIAFTAMVRGKAQVHLMNADGSGLRVLTYNRKLSCSNVTWLPRTHLLLLLCGQTVTPFGEKFGSFVDGGYYLLSADDPASTPRFLAKKGSMAISFAIEAQPKAQNVP